jgi:hypothetical protein
LNSLTFIWWHSTNARIFARPRFVCLRATAAGALRHDFQCGHPLCVFWKEVDWLFLIAWAIVILALVLIRYPFRRSYPRKPPTDAETLGWGYRYLYGVAANASLFHAGQVRSSDISGVCADGNDFGKHLDIVVLAVLPYAARVMSVGDELHLAMPGMRHAGHGWI